MDLINGKKLLVAGQVKGLGKIKREGLQQNLLGANISDHMSEDGSMEFDLARPIGGHGSTYVDVLYLDESLRVVQGHKGSIFVMTRVSK
jgi:hypothetical protein